MSDGCSGGEAVEQEQMVGGIGDGVEEVEDKGRLHTSEGVLSSFVFFSLRHTVF